MSREFAQTERLKAVLPAFLIPSDREKDAVVTGRWHIWLLIPALLLLTGLGAYGLNMDLLWVDEYFTVGNIGGVLRVPYNPAEVWVSVSQYSPQHVPGYFMLISGWVALTGWTPFAMRAFSLLTALLTVALTYRIGVEWLSARIGLYAALVLSVSALFIHFAHEARMYMLMALLTVFTLWLYRRVILPGRPPKRWEWAGLFVGVFGLIWVHTVSTVVVAAVGLYHLLFVPKNRRWWGVVALLALAGLSFLPWLQIVIDGAQFVNVGKDTGIPVAGPLGVVELTARFFSGGAMGLLLFSIAAALAGIRQRGAVLLWIFKLFILALTLVLNEVVPMISESRPRYVLPLWPLLALLVGLGLTTLQRYRQHIPAMLFLSAWLWFGLSSTLNPQFLMDVDGPRHLAITPPVREIIRETNRLGDSEDMLLSFSREHYLVTEVKFGPVIEFYLRDLRVPSHWISLPDEPAPDEIRADIRETVGTRLDVWLAYEPILAPETLLPYREALETDYQRCETPVAEPDFTIEHYALAAFGCLADSESQIAVFDGSITLNEARLAAAGDQLLVAAGWSVSESVPPETYSVSFKLWNAAGEFVTQADTGLRAAGFGWQLATLPTADLPAGDYTLTATVYDWRSGATLPGQAGDYTGEIVPVTDVSLPFGL